MGQSGELSEVMRVVCLAHPVPGTKQALITWMLITGEILTKKVLFEKQLLMVWQKRKTDFWG